MRGWDVRTAWRFIGRERKRHTHFGDGVSTSVQEATNHSLIWDIHPHLCCSSHEENSNFDIGAIDCVTMTFPSITSAHCRQLPSPHMPDTGNGANKSIQGCDLQNLIGPLGKAPVIRELVMTRLGGKCGSAVSVGFTGSERNPIPSKLCGVGLSESHLKEGTCLPQCQLLLAVDYGNHLCGFQLSQRPAPSGQGLNLF